MLNNYEKRTIWQVADGHLLPDESIAKYDYITHYEDNHGAGDLNNATSFSYTTTNQDIWMLPSESYLKLKVVFKKQNGTDYNWEDVEAVAAQGGEPAVAAVVADNVSMNNNGFNIFEEARLYIDDEEVERISYLGIATLVNNLLTYNQNGQIESIKHSQFWFLGDDEDDDRQEYCRDIAHGSVPLLLPVDKIFPFYAENRQAFRGAKHRITLTLNSANSVLKTPANKDGKFYITNMVWQVPRVEPSGDHKLEVERAMAASTFSTMEWEAISTFKLQPPRQEETRVTLSNTIHKPTHIWVLMQKLDKINSQRNDAMVFDNMKMARASVEINGITYPDKPVDHDFTNRDILELYHKYLQGCSGGKSLVSLTDFASKYPLLHFDVSHHQDELYDNVAFPDIVLNMKFAIAPTEDYVIWVIIYNRRRAQMSLADGKMKVLK